MMGGGGEEDSSEGRVDKPPGPGPGQPHYRFKSTADFFVDISILDSPPPDQDLKFFSKINDLF